MNNLVEISYSNSSSLTEIKIIEPLVSIDINEEEIDNINLDISTQMTNVVVDIPQILITEVSNSSIGGINSSQFINGETPNGLINGINNIFTSINPFIISSLEVFVNGIRQKLLNDYNTLGNNTIIFNTSPGSTETIIINYMRL